MNFWNFPPPYQYNIRKRKSQVQPNLSLVKRVFGTGKVNYDAEEVCCGKSEWCNTVKLSFAKVPIKWFAIAEKCIYCVEGELSRDGVICEQYSFLEKRQIRELNWEVF